MSDHSQIKNLLISGATQFVGSRISQKKSNMFWSIASGILAAFGIIFLAIATFFYFAQMEVFALAGLYTSIMIFVLSAGCYLFKKMKERQLEKEILREQIALENMAEVALTTYEKELEESVKQNPIMSLIISSVSGYALAKKYF